MIYILTPNRTDFLTIFKNLKAKQNDVKWITAPYQLYGRTISVTKDKVIKGECYDNFSQPYRDSIELQIKIRQSHQGIK